MTPSVSCALLASLGRFGRVCFLRSSAVSSGRSTGHREFEAELHDICLRCADNLHRAHTCPPHLQPADVSAKVLRGWSVEGLDELFVVGMELVYVLDVIAA